MRIAPLANNAMKYILEARCPLIFLALVVPLFSTPASPANADGIDVVWLMTRVGGWRTHPALSVAIVFGLMLINYLLNIVVVGMPAARLLHIKLAALLRDLAVFTLLGQIADRVGAIGGLLLGSPIGGLAGLQGERAVEVEFLVGVAVNFVLSGLAVGVLALWYLRRWGVKRRFAIGIATTAGVITNPAWAMLSWFIRA